MVFLLIFEFTTYLTCYFNILPKATLLPIKYSLMKCQCSQILKANFWISTVCKFLLDFLLLWFYVKLTLGNLETFIGSEFWFHKLLHFLKAEKYYQIIIIQSPYNCKDGNFELLQSTKLISRKIWETENSWNWQHWYFFFKL